MDDREVCEERSSTHTIRKSSLIINRSPGVDFPVPFTTRN